MPERFHENLHESGGDKKIQQTFDELREAGYEFSVSEDSSEYIIDFGDKQTHVTKAGGEKHTASLIRQVIEGSRE